MYEGSVSKGTANTCLTFCVLGNFACVCRPQCISFTINFFKLSFKTIPRVSNSFDSDQVRRSIGPDLDQTVKVIQASHETRH